MSSVVVSGWRILDVAPEQSHEAAAGADLRVAQHTTSNRRAVARIVQTSYLEANPPATAQLLNEVLVLKELSHPCINALHVAERTPQCVYLVFDNTRGGDLLRCLRAHGRRGLPVTQAFGIFHQLVSGLMHMHEKGVWHRDMRLEHVLLKNTYEASRVPSVQIAHFRAALRGACTDPAWRSARCASAHYASPEILRSMPYDPASSDIWGLGVIAYALYTGRLPFLGASVEELTKRVLSGNGPEEMPQHLPMGLIVLLRRMLCQEEKNRIALKEIICHPYWVEACRAASLDATAVSPGSTTPAMVLQVTPPPALIAKTGTDATHTVIRTIQPQQRSSVPNQQHKPVDPHALFRQHSAPAALPNNGRPQALNNVTTVQVPPALRPKRTVEVDQRSSGAHHDTALARHNTHACRPTSPISTSSVSSASSEVTPLKLQIPPDTPPMIPAPLSPMSSGMPMFDLSSPLGPLRIIPSDLSIAIESRSTTTSPRTSHVVFWPSSAAERVVSPSIPGCIDDHEFPSFPNMGCVTPRSPPTPASLLVPSMDSNLSHQSSVSSATSSAHLSALLVPAVALHGTHIPITEVDCRGVKSVPFLQTLLMQLQQFTSDLEKQQATLKNATRGKMIEASVTNVSDDSTRRSTESKSNLCEPTSDEAVLDQAVENPDGEVIDWMANMQSRHPPVAMRQMLQKDGSCLEKAVYNLVVSYRARGGRIGLSSSTSTASTTSPKSETSGVDFRKFGLAAGIAQTAPPSPARPTIMGAQKMSSTASETILTPRRTGEDCKQSPSRKSSTKGFRGFSRLSFPVRSTAIR